MKIEKIKTTNIENAIRGMRNPLNSWDKSTSLFGVGTEEEVLKKAEQVSQTYDVPLTAQTFLLENGIAAIPNTSYFNYDFLCAEDLNLALRLIKSGNEHRKFLRQIFISMDITAPLYFWKEMDTYKVSTTANSTSTMHTLIKTPITMDCFETDDFQRSVYCPFDLIDDLENLRKTYIMTRDKKYWKELIRWLPESFLQKRTFTCSMETILNICNQRKGHKLSEWATVINAIKENVKWAKPFIFGEDYEYYKAK